MQARPETVKLLFATINNTKQGIICMKSTVVALSALALTLGSLTLQAESLRDIYELALENDAQLKAEEAVYLARRKQRTLAGRRCCPRS